MNGREWRVLKTFQEREEEANQLLPRGLHVWTACGTRGQRGGFHVRHMWLTRGHQAWPKGLACSSRVLRPYSGLRTPISDFESIFGLQIMTPSHTTKTIKLCKNVEKSSRKMTTKTTQRMRTQSSIVTSFELVT